MLHTPPKHTPPKHRRAMPSWVTNPDYLQNNARCTRVGQSLCGGGHICPRHTPGDYAEALARHASDVYGTGSIAIAWPEEDS